jgi:membrane-associated PAP2 superfamily phosphatase
MYVFLLNFALHHNGGMEAIKHRLYKYGSIVAFLAKLGIYGLKPETESA